MAIPKHKLALLISGLKPKKGSEEEPPEGEEDGEDGYDQKLDTVVNQLADAVVSGKRDAVVEALHAFHDCITGEDKTEDEGEEGDEPEMPGMHSKY